MRLPRVKIRQIAIVVACLIAGGAVALVWERSIRHRAADPAPPAMNHKHLMESMSAHARASGGLAPGSIISGLARGLEVGSPAPDFALPAARRRGLALELPRQARSPR